MSVKVDRSLGLPKSEYFPEPAGQVGHRTAPHGVRRRAHHRPPVARG